MRLLRLTLLTAVLCLSFFQCFVCIAENEIISGPVEIEVGEAEAIGTNGLFAETEDIRTDTSVTYEPDNNHKAISASNNSGFEIDEDGTLSRYGGIDKNVVIPNEVKEIWWMAFYDDEYMESVIIPNSVTEIGWNSFAYCINLKSVVIPNSVTTLGSGAFSGCTGLQNLQISNSLSELQDYTFSDCKSLINVTIPNNVTTIGSYCFQDCDSLVNIVIPEGVTSIGDCAFGGCDKLESITIPASVTSIDRNAFRESERLVILGEAGTYAERFASAVGIPFNASIVTIRKDLYEETEKGNIEGHPYAYINQTFQLTAEQHPANLATALKWSSSDTSIATVDQDGVVTGVGPGTAIITAGTEDGRGRAAQVDFIVPESTSIEFTNDWGGTLTDPEAILNETTEIYASAETPYSDNTGIEMPVTFASSDDTTVQIERTERTTDGNYRLILKACKLGKATVTATTPDNGKADIEITVVRPEPESIKIDQKGPIHIKVGKTVALSAAISPADADQSLKTWSTGNSSVAKVSASGVVTAVAEGWTYISAGIKDRYESDSIEVYVEPDNPTKVTLNKTKATLGAKCTLTLKAKLTPSDTKTKLTWSSSKPKVAKVSQKGVVTALTKGSAIITVTAANGKKATAKITVKPGPKTIALYNGNKKLKAGSTLELKKGKSLALTAKLPKGTLSTLTWNSNKPTIAKVGKTGKVKALKKGTATITVKAANGKKAKVKIKVK